MVVGTITSENHVPQIQVGEGLKPPTLEKRISCSTNRLHAFTQPDELVLYAQPNIHSKVNARIKADSRVDIEYTLSQGKILWAKTPGGYFIFYNGYTNLDAVTPAVHNAPTKQIISDFEFRLLELSKLAKCPQRKFVLERLSEEDNDEKEVAAETITKTEETSSGIKKAWGKGVGFGCDFDNKAWNIGAWEASQVTNESRLVGLVDRIVRGSLEKQNFSQLRDGCLFPMLHSYLINDSLNDISRHFGLYKVLFELTQKLIVVEEFKDLFLEDLGDGSLVKKLQVMYEKAKLVRSLSANLEKQDLPEEATGGTVPYYDYIDSHEGRHVSEHVSKNLAFESAKLICDTHDAFAKVFNFEPLEKAVEEPEEKKESATEVEYCEFMRENCFDMFEGQYRHHHFIAKKKMEVVLSRKLMKRLASEFSDLPASLPITEESSVFFRVSEDNMPFCQMLIIPCDGTPYSGGCFPFDICYPTKYPMVPPLVNLQTTGNAAVRFNPNLYNCGKVCLSLLGTWESYNQGESWNPGLSTTLQVAISIQSLIFVPEPYYNEPSYEQEMGTDSGNQRSVDYNKNISKGTVKYAMIDMIKNPPPAFKDVVQAHFRMQKDRVLKNAARMIGEDAEDFKTLKNLLEPTVAQPVLKEESQANDVPSKTPETK